MHKENDFIKYLHELLEPLGTVNIKPMFGGYGVYYQDLMFGLVANNTFYLKADEANQPDFEKRNLKPFVYESKSRKPVTMSYYEAPEEGMDSAQELRPWAYKAYEAARRAVAKKPKKELSVVKQTKKKSKLKKRTKKANSKKAHKVIKKSSKKEGSKSIRKKTSRKKTK